MIATDPGIPFAPGELLPAAVVLGVVWLGTVSAVVFAAQQRRLQAATLQLSVTDPLTGLFNRAQIYVDLDQEVRRSRRSLRPFCLLMVDMDGLKLINDSLGHERGDAAIRGIAGAIRRSIRTVDSAYRYAGDEFVVLLPETDFGGAFVVAEKIRQGAEELAGDADPRGGPDDGQRRPRVAPRGRLDRRGADARRGPRHVRRQDQRQEPGERLSATRRSRPRSRRGPSPRSRPWGSWRAFGILAGPPGGPIRHRARDHGGAVNQAVEPA